MHGGNDRSQVLFNYVKGVETAVVIKGYDPLNLARVDENSCRAVRLLSASHYKIQILFQTIRIII